MQKRTSKSALALPPAPPRKPSAPYYSQRDRVRQEAVWRSAVRKEARLASAFTQHPAFQMNLVRQAGDLQRLNYSHNRIELITDKIGDSNAHTAQQRAAKAAVCLPNSYEVQMIEHMAKGPPQ